MFRLCQNRMLPIIVITFPVFISYIITSVNMRSKIRKQLLQDSGKFGYRHIQIRVRSETNTDFPIACRHVRMNVLFQFGEPLF
ncbi:hypothetical protein IJ22_34090 [Paenibacillus naphthalenovorans]|uniref:Uncharacterized protein n=1 Tax=Paenibacillus naphthalenovorans TaxID=162209 RepID=A0A0U2WEJ9_9BACL|nr:hypothetical protein IJ22_34090 [Paenibacillus naphthalenovorans]